jgi:hypothetical protein
MDGMGVYIESKKVLTKYSEHTNWRKIHESIW